MKLRWSALGLAVGLLVDVHASGFMPLLAMCGNAGDAPITALVRHWQAMPAAEAGMLVGCIFEWAQAPKQDRPGMALATGIVLMSLGALAGEVVMRAVAPGPSAVAGTARFAGMIVGMFAGLAANTPCWRNLSPFLRRS